VLPGKLAARRGDDFKVRAAVHKKAHGLIGLVEGTKEGLISAVVLGHDAAEVFEGQGRHAAGLEGARVE